MAFSSVLMRLLLPFSVLALSVVAVFNVSVIDADFLPLLVYLPYPLLLVAMILSHQFNRGHSFCVALILLLSYGFIQHFLQRPLDEPEVAILYRTMSFAYPLLLLPLIFLPERGLWNLYGIAQLCIVGMMIGGAYFLSLQPILQSESWQPWLTTWPAEGYVLSLGASLGFILVFLLGLGMFVIRGSDIQVVLLIALVSVYLLLVLFYKPFISTLLLSAAAICVIVGLLRSSHDMAFRDELTGLRNRRAFNERLRGLGRKYVIASLDVDHFKKFNDTHGHDVGDDVLKLVASQIGAVKGGGVAYRYGGEEFCIVFAGKALDDCETHLENVRENIADYKMVLRDQQTRPSANKEGKQQRNVKNKKPKTVQVTISIGVAERNDKERLPEDVLKASDKALYKAKKNGRNCLAGC